MRIKKKRFKSVKELAEELSKVERVKCYVCEKEANCFVYSSGHPVCIRCQKTADELGKALKL